MRVNVDDKALADPRFARLGVRTKSNRHEAIGRCLMVWMFAYQSRTDLITIEDVDGIADRTGFGAAMLAVGLADRSDHAESGLRLRGVAKRIGFLKNLDGMREKSSAVRKGRRDMPTASANGLAGGGGSLTLDLDLSLPPDLDHALDLDQVGATAPPVGSSGEKTSPDHQPALERFHALYFGAYGTKPTWGGKQVAMLKRLVASHTASEVVRRMEILFSNPPTWLRPPYDVGTLVQHFDKLAAVAVDPVRRDARGGLTAADLLAIAAEERAKGVAS